MFDPASHPAWLCTDALGIGRLQTKEEGLRVKFKNTTPAQRKCHGDKRWQRWRGYCCASQHEIAPLNRIAAGGSLG